MKFQTDPPTTSLLTRTKQHCLIGIRGTVRRSTDSWFVHCNVGRLGSMHARWTLSNRLVIDTDVIFWEGDPADPTRKPPEMYTLIENFCLGLRRLEIFGRPTSLRRGWVTVMGQGQDERLVSLNDTQGTVNVEGEEGGRATKWDRDSWEEGIKDLSNGGKAVVPMTPEIDALRPKSPFRPNQTNPTGSMPIGGGVINPRFVSGNRPGFVSGPQGMQAMGGQNPMMVQPIMGMGMNSMGMGMGTGVDEMLGAWNPMIGGMNIPTMGNMNVGNLGSMNTASLGNVGRIGMPIMSGGGGFGAGMFNPGMGVGMGWGDQGQFGMEGGWDGDAMMAAGVGGLGSDMSMNGMNTMNMNGGMGIGQWGTGTY